MYRYAQILNGKAHWIFEDEMTLAEIGQHKFNLEQITLVDITNVADVQEGYDYDGSNFIAPVTPQPSPEDTVAKYTAIVQKHLDDTAKTRNYDGILSICSYVTSTDPTFSKEGQAGVVWRDAVWRTCYEILAAVQAGTRTAPTDIISELPAFTWGD